jgi:DNA repair photolyase
MELAGFGAAAVFLSVTTLDMELARKLEPRASKPGQRIEAIGRLAEAGVPTGVMVSPVIPGLTDAEMPAILSAAAKAGARYAGYTTLRLPGAVAPLFEDWLDRHATGKKSKVLSRIRGLRGGKLYEARFGTRMRGEGTMAEILSRIFKTNCQRLGLNLEPLSLSIAAFRKPGTPARQLHLFD